ncbi:hypothetical protein QVD17_03604 [Tagetes erecta]|uniref:F-box/LRR-repeat protein 15/At3g58940/PEG3-like LRR domain-containing protein n=1 Tax=Tagetes erecta TaxID=13708 RepID=A0AAD8PA34_TARER|nr:hypothetical protein QVD17_03604 [Tagetes erecta]
MEDSDHTWVEIDQIIHHLSRNHALTKLKLDFNEFDSDNLYGLPFSVFSLNNLTDLYLDSCDVNFKPIFNGFGSLTNLTLKRIVITREALLHLLSNCPSLKRVCLMLEEYADCDESPIVDLFKFLPMIEHLTTWGYLNTVDVNFAQEEFPASLIHLKYFCVEGLCVGDIYGLTFLGVLTKCSPNLEKIKLRTEISFDLDADEVKRCFVILEKYSDVWLEHLNELEILYFRYYELDMLFYDFILARSPNLKKVVLYRPSVHEGDEELEMLKALFSAPRPPNASPVKIILKTPSRFEVFKGFDDKD